MGASIGEGEDHEVLACEAVCGVVFFGIANELGFRAHFPKRDFLVAEEIKGILGISPGVIA